jgi:hypothetical protein
MVKQWICVLVFYQQEDAIFIQNRHDIPAESLSADSGPLRSSTIFLD